MAATKKPTNRAGAGAKNADEKTERAAKKPATAPAKKRAATSTSKGSAAKGTAKSRQAAPARRNAPKSPKSAQKGNEAAREAHAPVERRVGHTPTGQVVPVTKQKTFRLPEDVIAIIRTAVVEAAVRGDRVTESQSVTAAVRAWGKKHGYDKPHEDLL